MVNSLNAALSKIAIGRERGYTLGELIVASAVRENRELRSAEDGQGYLVRVHPGGVDELPANTGWDLKISPSLSRATEPTGEALKAIREYDKEGFWTS